MKIDFSKVSLQKLEQLRKRLEAQQTVRQSNRQREYELNRQKGLNYLNEYERIKHEIEKGGPWGIPIEPALKTRADKLKSLASQIGYKFPDYKLPK
jgi:hypothetical protein